MRITPFLLTSILLLNLLVALPVAAEAPVTIRIDRTDAASFPEAAAVVTVRDEYGVPIRDLEPANFDVSEDRTLKSRPIAAVEPFVNPDVQLSVVLAVDVSGSMTGAKLRDAQEAARRFLDGLTDRDAAALIAFAGAIGLDGTDPGREHGFSQDKVPLYAVIDSLKAGGATPLYDTAYKAVQWAAAQPAGNRAVLLFTDGKEEKTADGKGGSQVANEDSPIREANRVGVPVFTVGLGADADEAYLKRLALETGGTYQHATNSAELARLFRNVSDLLKQQYRITYTSGLFADGGTHQVLIAVKVGQHTAFDEASLGPLPLIASPVPSVTQKPEPTATPAPTNTAAPTPTPMATPGPLPVNSPPPPAATTASLLGVPYWGWGAFVLLAALLAGWALFSTRRAASRLATSYRCLRCGHELDSENAPCPSCGFQGSFTEKT